jgi:phosphinothricin acetyltransferase
MASPHVTTAWTVRSARTDDVPAIANIYNHFVLNSTCTFATEPEGEEYWHAWQIARSDAFPAVVVEESNHVIGWGTLSRWNSRCAYRFSAEDSVYIHPNHHHRGIGRAILAELIERAKAAGHRNVIAQIADHQPASERLHANFGFRKAGVLEGVGCKFDRWIDVAIWQLRLNGN